MDALDWNILGELNANCRAPLTSLAKKLKVGRNVIAYRLDNLEKGGVIKNYICSLDLGKLGYKTYKIYFKTRNTASEKSFVERLVQNKQAISVVKIEGSFDYSCVIAVKSVRELDTFLTQLKSDFRDIIRDCIVSIVVYSRLDKFWKPFAQKRYEQLGFIEYSGEGSEAIVDETDKRLLQELGQNANMPLVKLAKKTGLSLDIVKYRLKKLGKSVINLFRIELDLNKLGLFHYVILLQTRPAAVSDERKLLAWCSFKNSVMYCTKTIGHFDFEINIVIKGINDLNAFLSEIKSGFGGIVDSYEVILTSKSLKLNYVPF